jgi:hypothetical protein
MKTWFLQSLAYCYKLSLILLSLCSVGSFSHIALAAEEAAPPQQRSETSSELSTNSSWEDFSQLMERQREREKMEGVSYIVSGTLILLGGEVGYRGSNDSIQKFAYSFSQSLAIGAIGFGIYTYNRGAASNDVYRMLRDTTGLTLNQREQMLKIYLEGHYHRRKNARWIQLISHSLIAALNLSKASQTNDPELRNALYTFGGLNALAAISITF